MRKFKALIAAAVLVCAAPLLTGCSNDSAPESGVSIENGWAKSAVADGMTGVFGTLVNSTDDDVIIVSVESDSAGMVELHEVTADGVMQEIGDDVVIPAGGTYELAPGADHIMLMSLQRDLLAGDEVSFTLQLRSPSGDESTHEFTVLVKDYAGANEEYGDAHGDHAHDDHSHDDHSHENHNDHDHDDEH